MTEAARKPSVFHLIVLYILWILISEFLPDLFRLTGLRGNVNAYVLAATRMTFLLLITWLYISLFEKISFSSGFNVCFKNVGRSILWAFIFSLGALAVLAAYQFLIVRPLLEKAVEASAAPSSVSLKPIEYRLLEYLYVVYEGLIEVFIFIGFLLDRLAKRWNWTVAVIVSNMAFALWHYPYWEKGWLEGSLMIFLAFLAGTVISLSYVKTKNTLSPAICHTLVDTPNAIRELLGML